jgi:hypothetical protein
MMSKVLRNFVRNMHMVPVFQFVSDNKELMIAELLNESGSCAQGQVIRQAQQLNPIIRPRRCAELRETRYGCETYIYVKRTSEGKYEIAALKEGHNHAVVTPSKRHLLQSNHSVTEKAKTTLFNYHKASIGTSQAYMLLQVGAEGFEYVGCTKKDLQNYYSDFRHKIKDTDAQMFIDNLYALQELDHNVFFDYEVVDGYLILVMYYLLILLTA